MLEDENNITMAARLGAALQKPNTEHGGIAYCTIPDGYKLQDLEHLLPQPTRKRAAVITTTPTSFIDYLNKHSQGQDSTIYANIDSEKSHCNLVAVIDDNSSVEPAWRDHTCQLAPKLAVEWARWMSKNKAPMTQSQFAAWLEDNLPDIASVPGMPSGTDILQMALGFEANSDKKFRSKINLQSGGVQFEFVEDETKETRTRMTVFERFTLGIPVFDGSSSAYPLEARLKYREKSGEITFWYELIRPDRVFKTAVAAELENIKQGTSLLIIYGKHL